jgi:hypothetical protein
VAVLTQAEIDKLLEAINSDNTESDRERKAYKQGLKKQATTLSGLLSAIRAAWMGEYRINFYLSDDEAAELITRYVKIKTCRMG